MTVISDQLSVVGDNTGAKLMSGKFFVWLLTTLFLATAFSAQAQQPTKIPRIGYLTGSPFQLPRAALRHSGKGCASMVTSRGKTLSLSGDLQRGNWIASPRSRPSWCVSR
jgi:hypothetical protein